MRASRGTSKGFFDTYIVYIICLYLCFSHIYFLGDMNYRINPCDMNIRKVASSEDYKLLLEYDQLTQQKNQKRIFHQFNEGDITFKPTFKYDVDSDEWDSRLVKYMVYFHTVC